MIAGSVVTGVPWAFSVTAAVAADYDDKTGYLLMPGIGPWLMLLAGGAKDRDCGGSEVCNGSRAEVRSILVLDGLVQTGGAAMFIAGLMVPRKRLVPIASVNVTPLQLSRDGYGVGAFGTF